MFRILNGFHDPSRWVSPLLMMSLLGASLVGPTAVAASNSARDGMPAWHERERGADVVYFDVTWGNNHFVAAGQSTFRVSSDGLAWTSIIPSTLDNMLDVLFVDGRFYAVGYLEGPLLDSLDGTNWNTINVGEVNRQGTSLAKGNGRLVMAGYDHVAYQGAAWVSMDGGQNFTQFFPGVTTIQDIVFDGRRFAAVGHEYGNGRILLSEDGESWNIVTSVSLPQLRGIARGRGLLVVVGMGGVIATSPDGTTWTNRQSGTDVTLVAIAYGNGLFVATGEDGVILVSGDGITWAKATSGTTDLLRGIGFGANTFIAVGDNSPDSDQYIILQSDVIPPLDTRGDLDGDDWVTLKDIIIGCQVLTGMSPSSLRPDYIGSPADVDGDDRVGPAEAIHGLRRVAGITG